MYRKKMNRILSALVAAVILISLSSIGIGAKGITLNVAGTVHTFEEDAHYEMNTSSKSNESTLGTILLSGDINTSGTMGAYAKYIVNRENFSINYSFDTSVLDVAATEWHIAEDKSKQVNDVKLEENIRFGALIVQSSRDGKLWQTDVTLTNVFTRDSVLKNSVFSSNDIQLQNGCYYRVIVAYMLEKQVESTNILGYEKENFEAKKIAEVYEFYAISGDISKTSSPAEVPRREMGSTIKTKKDSGYIGELVIDKDDPHFDMKLGTFVINGYSRETTDGEVPVFLKNTGDKVTLWFTLEQDINCLGGDETLSISEDTNGYEVHSNPNLSVKQTNLKHGALIIRVTDHEGNTQKPIIYTDFLAANARTGANTKVQLFEEGDYEVTLLYEIKKDNIHVGTVKAVPTYTNYKISFKFKIRNGNCIVFPFDSATGRELSDGAMTPNGFRLDMAKSRYLTIDVQREVINVNRDGTLSTDIRFNRPAKDGTVYCDEGIYTVTAKNLYTDGEATVKTFYVGTNKYMIAMSQQGYTLEELNALIRDGATVEDDGSVTLPPPPTAATEPATETTVPLSEATETMPITEDTTASAAVTNDTEATEVAAIEAAVTGENAEPHAGISPAVYGVIAVVVAGVGIMVRAKKRKPAQDSEQ